MTHGVVVQVRALGGDTAINERCIELQDGKLKTPSAAAACDDDSDADEPVSVPTPTARSKRSRTGCAFYGCPSQSTAVDMMLVPFAVLILFA